MRMHRLDVNKDKQISWGEFTDFVGLASFEVEHKVRSRVWWWLPRAWTTLLPVSLLLAFVIAGTAAVAQVRSVFDSIVAAVDAGQSLEQVLGIDASALTMPIARCV